MNVSLKTLACAVVATCALAVPAFADDSHSISWSGQVDDTVIVRIHADRVRTSAIHGAAPVNVTTNVYDPLPDAPAHVWLSQVHGRGTVRLVQEPSFENNYTAVIRLKDPQKGPEYYSFVLKWDNDQNGSGNRGYYHDRDDND
jgi:hypothetical protein